MNTMQSNSSIFLSIYNKLDDYMRTSLNADEYISHTDLINKMVQKGNNVFKRYCNELKQYAKLRNSIVHNPMQREANPIAEPHDVIVSNYQQLLDRLLRPPLALKEIAVPSEKIFVTTLKENALKIMKIMNKKIYTHVPVVEDEKFIGVFSENTIFSYITSEEELLMHDGLLIKDFIKYIPIDNHISEKFIFVSKNISTIEVEEIFSNELRENKRIAAIFLTENGQVHEKLLGLITPWDIAGYTL